MAFAKEWVAGPTSARQHTSFTPELAQTNFLVCADGHDLLPGVAHLLKGETASRHRTTGQGLGGAGALLGPSKSLIYCFVGILRSHDYRDVITSPQ